MKISILLSSIILASLFFSSCEQDPPVPEDKDITETDTTITEIKYVDVDINFKAQVEGTDLIFNQNFTDPLGYRYQIETFRFYLSNIEFTNAENEVVSFEDVAFLKFGENQSSSPIIPTSITSKLPEGNYNKVSFDLGVDPSVNKSDPSLYDREHPLSIYQGMHWSWNTGYIFFKLEGRADSMPGGNGSLNSSLLYHFGTDPLLRNIAFQIDLNVDSISSSALDFGFDINKVFAGESDTINIVSNGFNQTTEDFDFAERAMNHVDDAFYLIE